MHILDILIDAFLELKELQEEEQIFTEADLADVTWFEEGLADEIE